MDFFNIIDISASGLTAQRTRMNVISINLANIETTRTEQGGPYRRKVVVLETKPIEDFDSLLSSSFEPIGGVRVREIVEDTKTPFKRVYDPSHPDADKTGHVTMPNVDIVLEMTNMMMAKRSYEANVTAIKATKGMALKALEIGR